MLDSETKYIPDTAISKVKLQQFVKPHILYMDLDYHMVKKFVVHSLGPVGSPRYGSPAGGSGGLAALLLIMEWKAR
jgi:hypothetical protein